MTSKTCCLIFSIEVFIKSVLQRLIILPNINNDKKFTKRTFSCLEMRSMQKRKKVTLYSYLIYERLHQSVFMHDVLKYIPK